MLLVVFGAGASWDSIPERHVQESDPSAFSWRPPLTNDLFHSRQNFRAILENYDECIPIVPALRRDIDDGTFSLEQALARLSDRPGDGLRAQQMLAIRYYLRDVLDRAGTSWGYQVTHATNYVALLETLRTWNADGGADFAFTTFNYDLMLENAAKRTFDFRHKYVDSYLTGQRVKIFRPHGCVSWVQRIETSVMAVLDDPNARLIDWHETLQYTDRYAFAADVRPNEGVPAIAVPIAGKSEYVCPPAHLTAFEELLPSVDSLIIIGWKGMDSDLIDLLKEHAKAPLRVYIVDGCLSSGLEVAANLCEADLEFHYDVYARALRRGFSGFVRDDEALAAALDGKGDFKHSRDLDLAEIEKLAQRDRAAGRR